ncbi:unnamed protein product [Kuraishia capsulata CBS 1993]|uniref:protein kinase C n=1 Tax=Kuraishia capsulata CBS 1993 TaxID=1382522 RepID=W6MV21_9ASCO|nr:uncharacterized protein KUCA_T00005720001 [Kuraishia capsulata CBS 1993]CDK29727.1 unnamed protein product [Kuraishia capsulata CBS 1993]
MSDPTDSKVQDILKKIERERNIKTGAANLKNRTTNQDVIQKCNASIRDAQTNIDYLQQMLNKLQIDQQGSRSPDRSVQSATHGQQYHAPSATSSDGYSKPIFSSLDLLKYECPSLGHRIQYMLQELQLKLQVEKKYREANEKMFKLYQMEGDRRSIAAAGIGRVEGDQKIQLLTKALKQYQQMHIDVDEVTKETAVLKTFPKKPLSGILTLNISLIRAVNHIAPARFSKGPETMVKITVDDIEKAHTKFSRNGKWNEEFHIDVEKGNEIGITVYDKNGDHLTPVALAWFSLADVAEEIRRKKNRGDETGWMSASFVQNNLTTGNNIPSRPSTDPAVHPQSSDALVKTGGNSSSEGSAADSSVTFSSWFVLEPAGHILLTFGFSKTSAFKNGSRGDAVNGLLRHGAIRQRKEEVLEHHGHKFVYKQFYNLMNCAMCGFFLPYSGYQCEDCRFLCHKKCYDKVITKCISKSSADRDPYEAKLNHRIPHRWELVTNKTAKWCCHCGYVLPLGRKNIRKCSECGVVCHTYCSHLVPDFCGMTMERASQILSEIKLTQNAIENTRKATTPSAAHARLPKPVTLPAKDLPPIPPQTNVQELKTYPGTGPQSQISAKEPIHKSYTHSHDPIADGYNYDSSKAASTTQLLEPSTYDIAAAKTEVPRVSEERERTRRTESRVARPTGPKPHDGEAKHRHRHKYGLDDFNFLAVLGKGNFGKVMLAESVHTKHLCAIKVLKKDFIVQNDEVESTKSEKRVFLIANKGQHPFLLNLHQCFQTENRVYFVMEYISGGDLMWHVQKARFSWRRAQFYAAEVLLALKFLHEHGVIYRDLKLDNILLTPDGHIKLADYGLCKEEMWYGCTTATFCGTPELMAPEILKEQKYDKAVDWWAFGVLLYQMLLTKSPFKGEDEDEVFNAILTDEPLYPIHMSKEAVDILQKLLTRDPKKRLGAGPSDAEEIMAHPYFSNIDFNDILSCNVTPPYIPEIRDPRDISYFDEEFTSQAAKLTPVNSLLSLSVQEQFRGFTYVSEDSVA